MSITDISLWKETMGSREEGTGGKLYAAATSGEMREVDKVHVVYRIMP